MILPGFTDSRHFRAAFPECVAYGFFPHRHQSLFETMPLIHGADERIDVRDLGFAAEFFATSRCVFWVEAPYCGSITPRMVVRRHGWQ